MKHWKQTVAALLAACLLLAGAPVALAEEAPPASSSEVEDAGTQAPSGVESEAAPLDEPSPSAAVLDEIPGLTFRTGTLLLVNRDTGEVLFAKNEKEARSMASTTKIMTFIVASEMIKDLEHTQIPIKQEVIDHVLNQGASMAGLQDRVGESFSALDLLYGLLVPSGCDAAEVLADYAGKGNVQAFVDKMNEKAAALGCTNTHYVDAHGLSDDNHTTAEDLLKVTKCALEMPYFTEITGTEYYTLPGASAPMTNTNYLIDYVNGREYYYPYATGIKTGYTTKAGRCLVSSAEKGSTRLLCIALGGEYSKETNYVNYAMVDTIQLYQWALSQTDSIAVKLDAKYRSLQIGKQTQLTATVDKAHTNLEAAPKITWTSSDPSIATVDENGVVTAHAMGEARITATTQTGDFAQCSVSCGYYHGLDVTSNYRDYSVEEKEPINWSAVKESGFDFAIIRAGWGWDDYPDQNDPAFVENVKGAVENGIPFGLQFVSYAVDETTARQEAEYLLRELEDYIPQYVSKMVLPIAYNVTNLTYVDENGITRLRFTPEENTAIVLAFQKAMAEHGYQTMCYANKTIFANMNVAALQQAGMGLWYAYYPYEPDFTTPVLVNDTYVPDVWQFRTDGYFPQASEALYTKEDVIYMRSVCTPPEVTAQQTENTREVTVTWKPVSYENNGYVLYRKTGEDGELTRLGEVSSDETSFRDTTVAWNETYTYYVAAKVTDLLHREEEVLGVAASPVTVLREEEPSGSTPSEDPGSSQTPDDSEMPADSTAPEEPSSSAVPEEPGTSQSPAPGDADSGHVETGDHAPVIWVVGISAGGAAAVLCLLTLKRRG